MKMVTEKPDPMKYGFDDEEEVLGHLRKGEHFPSIRLYLTALLAWVNEQQPPPVEEPAAKIPPRPWLCVVCKQDQSATLWLCLGCFQVACNVHRLHDDHDFRVTMATAPCGCRAQEGDWINEPRIVFCPKHAAADKMLETLKAVHFGMGQAYYGVQGTRELWEQYSPLILSVILDAEQS